MQRGYWEIKRESLPPQKERNKVVEYIVESYFEYMEEQPTNTVLSMLSDFILLDYIKSVNKKRSDKNQFLTEKQKKRRERREYLLSTNETLFDFLYSKYELNNDSLKKQERVIHQQREQRDKREIQEIKRVKRYEREKSGER